MVYSSIFKRQIYPMKKLWMLAAGVICWLSACKKEHAEETVLFPVQLNKQYGYIDRTGSLVISPQFADACCFTDDRALVSVSGDKRRWGYIGRSGSFLVQPVYYMGTSFSEGMAFVVAEDSCPVAINKDGIIKFALPDAERAENFHEGLAAYSILTPAGELWGFADVNGKVAIQPGFSAVRFYSSGLCGVMNAAGKWGFIDRSGKQVIGFQYDNITPFAGNAAEVEQGGRWGVIDKTGKFLISPAYANLDVDGARYLVNSTGKWGWADGNGKELIAAAYEDAFPFHEAELAPVMVQQKWGFIDRTGKMVVTPQYDFAYGFDGDLAVVRAGDKYGMISKEGTLVIPARYDDIGIDYYISRMTRNSSRFGVLSARNEPRFVAYRWLNGFYHHNLEDAQAVSTQEAKALLSQFAELYRMMPDSSRQEMMQVKIGIRDVRAGGDMAAVSYTTSDNPGKEQQLLLQRVNGKWLAQFSKNDGGSGQ